MQFCSIYNMQLLLEQWKRYIHEEELAEITQSRLDNSLPEEIQNIQPQELPFNNIFKNQFRLLVSLQPEHEKKLASMIQKLKKGGYTLDITLKDVPHKKTAAGGKTYIENHTMADINTRKSENYTIPASAKKRAGETIQKTFKASLGKTIRKELGQDDFDFYQKWQQFYMRDKNWERLEKIYEKKIKPISIIFSRYPLDVLRMSDFTGLTSCHSPKERRPYADHSYWYAAIEEAMYGAPVAYAVYDKDLPKNFDIKDYENKELFHDDNRNTGFLKPISRLRLRRFINHDDDYELLMAHKKTYGQAVPGFIQFVNQWTREQQQDLLDDIGEPKMKNFVAMGGTYIDPESRPAALFNMFFQTDSYSFQKAPFFDNDGEGGESIDLADQMEEEVAQIDESFSFQHVGAHCDVDLMDDDEDHPYCSFFGGFSIPLERYHLTEKFDDEIYRWDGRRTPGSYSLQRSQKRGTLKALLDGIMSNYIDSWDIIIEWSQDYIQFDVQLDIFILTPDGYREFCQQLAEYDDKYFVILQAMDAVLQHLGYVDEFNTKTHLFQMVHQLSDHLQHFEIEYDVDEATFTLESDYISLDPRILSKKITNQEFATFQSKGPHSQSFYDPQRNIDLLQSLFIKNLKPLQDKILRMAAIKAKGNLFESTEFLELAQYSPDEIRVTLHINSDGTIDLDFKIYIMSVDLDDAETDLLMEFAMFLNANWKAIQQIAQESFYQWAQQMGYAEPRLQLQEQNMHNLLKSWRKFIT